MPTVQDLGPELEDDVALAALGKGDRPKELVPQEEDDDDIDETLSERLWGLTEMFPEGLRNGTSKLTEVSTKTASWLWENGRKGIWVLASSAAILALPVMFETERVQMEEAQMAQQRQLLLGPNAAVSGAGGPAGMVPGAMPPLPQVTAPPQR